MRVVGNTHPGAVHSQNEDSIGWDLERGIAFVADGMGGHAAGEVASSIAKETILARADAPLTDAVLDAHIDKVYAVARELDELSARSAVLEGVGRRSIQRVGLVRYNPFEDTGGNQSFALALTDAKGDGFVLSSLHTRTGTRVYAKTISAGRSDAALSDEEREALRLAMAPPATGPTDSARSRERVAGSV